MPQPDYRAEMSPADFEAIPTDPDDPISYYYERLIDENHRIEDRFLADRAPLAELTRGQRLLLLLATFDGQVKNGGITQFFWNCSGSLFEVADAIEFFGEAELLAHYERALEALVGNKDRWLALREECARAGESPRWETFQETYGLLDLRWFDEAYFDRWDHDEQGKWGRLRRGLHHPLMTKLAEYVRAHPEEFITG